PPLAFCDLTSHGLQCQLSCPLLLQPRSTLFPYTTLFRSKAMHFLGLLSDGNVHSNISHLIALLKAAHAAGVKKAYCHILLDGREDRKSTRLNSSHVSISYAVFCLKKKKKRRVITYTYETP